MVRYRGLEGCAMRRGSRRTGCAPITSPKLPARACLSRPKHASRATAPRLKSSADSRLRLNEPLRQGSAMMLWRRSLLSRSRAAEFFNFFFVPVFRAAHAHPSKSRMKTASTSGAPPYEGRRAELFRRNIFAVSRKNTRETHAQCVDQCVNGRARQPPCR